MGTWEYDHLDDLPAASNSMQRMAELLVNPLLCGWPRERLSVRGNERDAGGLPDQLLTAFEKVSDVALFYYVGHGQISSNNELCLGLVRSSNEPERRGTTSLKFSDVRNALLRSPARTKIVILDCCFAGLAAAEILAAPLPDRLAMITKPTEIGIYAMAATGHDATAWCEDERECAWPQAYFTKYLADLIENGIPGKPRELGLETLFLQLRDNLTADKRPVPTHLGVNEAHGFVFAHNAAVPREVAPVPSPAPGPKPATRPVPRKWRHRMLAVSALAVVAAGVAIALAYLPRGTAHHRPDCQMPSQAHCRLGISLIGTFTDPNGSSVNYVTFSPDGRVLAAADRNGGTYLWDIAASRLAAVYTDPGSGYSGVDSATFSPNGKMLATADSNGSAYLWDMATGRLTATLTRPGRKGSLSSVAFSPDGKVLATADATKNGSVYLWNVATGRRTATLTDPGSQGVWSVAFSPDGKTLATADGDGSTYLWDLATGTVRATLSAGAGSFGSAWSVAFSPDGKTLATADMDATTRLWDVATGGIIATLVDPDSGGAGVWRAVFSPDGKTLATADSNNSTYLWEIATGRIIATLPGPGKFTGKSVAFSSDGMTLATPGDNGETYSAYHTYLWRISR